MHSGADLAGGGWWQGCGAACCAAVARRTSWRLDAARARARAGRRREASIPRQPARRVSSRLFTSLQSLHSHRQLNGAPTSDPCAACERASHPCRLSSARPSAAPARCPRRFLPNGARALRGIRSSSCMRYRWRRSRTRRQIDASRGKAAYMMQRGRPIFEAQWKGASSSTSEPSSTSTRSPALGGANGELSAKLAGQTHRWIQAPRGRRRVHRPRSRGQGGGRSPEVRPSAGEDKR